MTNMIDLPIDPPIYASVDLLPSTATPGVEAIVLTSPPSLYIYGQGVWNLVGGGGSGVYYGDGTTIVIDGSNVISLDPTGTIPFGMQDNITRLGHITTCTGIDNTVIGNSIPALGNFTNLSAQTSFQMPNLPAGVAGIAHFGVTGIVSCSLVVAADITNNTITYNKIQLISANKLLGNPTGSSASPSEMGIGAGLAFSGGNLICTITDTGITQLTGDVTAGPGSGSQVTTISAGVVTLAKLATLTALSLIGTASSGVAATPAAITGTAGQILRVADNGLSMGFGSINLANAASVGSTILLGANGGTGVANTGKTVTLGGNITTGGKLDLIGAFDTIFRVSAATDVTFPTSGTLATVGGSVSTVAGTTSQVLVNGATTPATGAVILSLPSTVVTTAYQSATNSSTTSAASTNPSYYIRNSNSTNNNWMTLAFLYTSSNIGALIGAQIPVQATANMDLVLFVGNSSTGTSEVLRLNGATKTVTLVNALSETNGGTNQSTYVQGDILYASNTDVLSKLAKGTNGAVLQIGATIPSWVTTLSSTVQGNITALGAVASCTSFVRGNFNIDSSSIMTNTSQPLFVVYLNAALANKTGAGTSYKFVFDTELVDIGNNFASGTTFTAPKTGNYLHCFYFRMNSISAAMNAVGIALTVTGTSAKIYNVSGQHAGNIRDVNNTIGLGGSIVVPMTAGDTCFINVAIFGGAGDSAGFNAAATGNPYSFWSGNLIS